MQLWTSIHYSTPRLAFKHRKLLQLSFLLKKSWHGNELRSVYFCKKNTVQSHFFLLITNLLFGLVLKIEWGNLLGQHGAKTVSILFKRLAWKRANIFANAFSTKLIFK